jgi:uncharacterized membrane protein
LLAVAGRIVANATGLVRFDPYPFEFLNFAPADEAILPSTVVLTARNRQGREAAEQAELPRRSGSWPSRTRRRWWERLSPVRSRSATRPVTVVGVRRRSDCE